LQVWLSSLELELAGEPINPTNVRVKVNGVEIPKPLTIGFADLFATVSREDFLTKPDPTGAVEVSVTWRIRRKGITMRKVPA
jgi:hypothetical protein